ncbi:DNA polymerase III subunit delta' [Gilvimarinus agarilyticus]|uniref:DNA polymerase III subunit delta' n=1 Tax=unclassified Gilvimarinus TaxID=2642066 RepID=UPI001C0997C9|nr:MULTISPECIES: DNA polymerase III subunit delta' [unclassified Gilvimarinus]MBU2884149.1 DNA polymerase III subunit delta' [Gilvimarinus agarilyticus]MDO6569321.1 DNA polymerase III subunit delta' [Gilvimarinus sp. 2_MG-2023]MDO6747068.1 DNA polymerase III subunit delta' [Gilvimarinus sp. 1_MG-2023]
MSDFPALPYPWQQSLWQSFYQQLLDNRLPHAVMLAGPRGLGKRHFARVMAQYLLCQSPRSESACGHCKSCELNKAGTHPDFALVTPEEPGKAIRVDDIRALAETQGKTAQQSGYKVVVLEPAEAMNNNAANALLKTLEEPAQKTLLVLVTDAPSAVLPTIRSRCQIRSLAIPSAEQSLHWLTPLVSGTDYNAKDLLVLARGAPLRARDLVHSDALEQQQSWLNDIGRLTLGQADAINVAAQWQKGDVTEQVNWLISWLHDLTCWQVGAEVPHIEQLDTAIKQTLHTMQPALLHRFQEKLLSCKKRLASGANPNKQLLLEELLMDWGVLLKNRQLRS